MFLSLLIRAEADVTTAEPFDQRQKPDLQLLMSFLYSVKVVLVTLEMHLSRLSGETVSVHSYCTVPL